MSDRINDSFRSTLLTRAAVISQDFRSATGFALAIQYLFVLANQGIFDCYELESGRRVEELEIAILLNAYVVKDLERAYKQFRKSTLYYYSTEVYNRHLAWCGFEKKANEIAEGFRQRDRERTLNAFNPETLHKFAVVGDADRCRSTVRQYIENGIDTPIIVSMSEDPEEYLVTVEASTPHNCN